MRDLTVLNRWRKTTGPVIESWGWAGDEYNGLFMIPYRVKGKLRTSVLRVICSSGEGWDHVSVSVAGRTPTWEEMEYVKRLFFEDDACCMQLHVPPEDHLSYNDHCLHIWQPHAGGIPRPPGDLVAPQSLKQLVRQVAANVAPLNTDPAAADTLHIQV